MWRYFNPNPCGKSTSDCAIRAVAKATGQDWGAAYIKLCAIGYDQCDLPNADYVWGAYLRDLGFRRRSLPDSDCYSVRDFAADHPCGTYVLATGTHAVTVVDGDYYDAWDSGDAIPIYYWRK